MGVTDYVSEAAVAEVVTTRDLGLCVLVKICRIEDSSSLLSSIVPTLIWAWMDQTFHKLSTLRGFVSNFN